MWNRERIRGVAVRVLACSGVALAVAGTAYLCALVWNPSDYTEVYEHVEFRQQDSIREALDRYRQARGKYPERLADLNDLEPGSVRTDQSGQVEDVFGTPYQYWVEGDGYTLFSLGADRKPGGVGMDADLYGRGLQDSTPTLRQFALRNNHGGVRATCVLAGVCAGLLCLPAWEKREGAKWPRLASLVRVAVTAAGAVVAALVMSTFHLSGH